LKLFSSQLEEFTEFWRAELVLTAESEPHPLYTVLLSLSIWLLRFSNSQVTLQRILRSRESPQDIYNLLSEVMRNLILSSKLPLLVVVSSHISTELLWWKLEAQSQRAESHITERLIEVDTSFDDSKYPLIYKIATVTNRSDITVRGYTDKSNSASYHSSVIASLVKESSCTCIYFRNRDQTFIFLQQTNKTIQSVFSLLLYFILISISMYCFSINSTLHLNPFLSLLSSILALQTIVGLGFAKSHQFTSVKWSFVLNRGLTDLCLALQY